MFAFLLQHINDVLLDWLLCIVAAIKLSLLFQSVQPKLHWCLTVLWLSSCSWNRSDSQQVTMLQHTFFLCFIPRFQRESTWLPPCQSWWHYVRRLTMISDLASTFCRYTLLGMVNLSTCIFHEYVYKGKSIFRFEQQKHWSCFALMTSQLHVFWVVSEWISRDCLRLLTIVCMLIQVHLTQAYPAMSYIRL